MSDKDGYLLQISTLQSTAIKILVEALKDILTDTNFIFNDTGIKLMTTDPTKTVLIHMKLGSDKLEKYYCPNQLVCGINILNLHKLIKTITFLLVESVIGSSPKKWSTLFILKAEDDIKNALELPDWKKGDEKLKLKLFNALFAGVIF